ncbi:regulatory particle triple-a 5A [Reticulomyxa filosa]|uniref:Regulatory particle triple-a 5A n=1 Tax=Reticulomyxa filosa TaxID=46433 RepID=X6N0W4_RETFI|nr:regulatory particle triple-a 5A [Reticulomyxa filosa]|eukprot:ETO18962.1 regulatory particle triple-a 5A [Reticulomyxa filosa]
MITDDLVGVNKDSYLILDKLPAEYDSRVKAMEVDEKPSEDYNDVGGLDKQIEELVEAVVLPIMHAERFEQIGIQPPKGVLLYGPPGTGKTLLARACANQSKATFLKLAGPQLVQMYIGDGAKIVRDAFALAKEKAPAIIFIDELDAIGTKRYDSDKSGDREVQRTMLELLNQLDGFSSDVRIKIIAATNRADILDPALLRSGRIDRKVECPLPNEIARERILKIHAKKMTCHPDVNFKELARCTEDFNGAQLKAVTVEADTKISWKALPLFKLKKKPICNIMRRKETNYNLFFCFLSYKKKNNASIDYCHLASLPFFVLFVRLSCLASSFIHIHEAKNLETLHEEIENNKPLLFPIAFLFQNKNNRTF